MLPASNSESYLANDPAAVPALRWPRDLPDTMIGRCRSETLRGIVAIEGCRVKF